MAKEVFRLCQEAYKNSAQLPSICITEKKKILALAAYNAAMACGNYNWLKFKWLVRAIFYNKFKNNIHYPDNVIRLNLWVHLFFICLRKNP